MSALQRELPVAYGRYERQVSGRLFQTSTDSCGLEAPFRRSVQADHLLGGSPTLAIGGS